LGGWDQGSFSRSSRLEGRNKASSSTASIDYFDDFVKVLDLNE